KDVEIANVELYIYYLRKKIDFKSIDAELKTVRGVGYSLLEKTTGGKESIND
ncbi:MAG: helix-turn-helix domain-containing protein, partial [Clostridia bacterium]|nr:helix-turn-helix domain-containing protein [Clostridia bacterium]